MTGTDLYKRNIAWSEANLDERSHALTLKCWESRPWMVNAYTGRLSDDRVREMMEWCRDEFGEEAWPIHGRPGNWYRGSATIFGWTDWGFATEDMMNRFVERWPVPEGIAA